MIVASDLDDTLYDERTYVKSGFRAVSEHLERTRGVPSSTSFGTLMRSLETSPRGTQIDELLRTLGLWTKGLVRELVFVYRHHDPDIALPVSTAEALVTLREAGHRLYLVTDGHKVVQAKKIAALGIADQFERCYLTNRYGVAHNKPSVHVFDLILRRERATGRSLVYVGDDPAKDFVGVRTLGAATIRVRAGRHAGVAPRPGYEPDLEVPGFASVPTAVARLERGTKSADSSTP
jgi:putative hydrolase of the HAD superfamily